MLTRDKLEQLSEEELKNLYQKILSEYEQKVSKNHRIRGMITRNIEKKKLRVNKLQNDIDALIAAHPELSVAKQDFDDSHQDPEELKKEIQEKQKALSLLQSKKLKLEKSIPEVSNHIKQQKVLEDKYKQEIASLITQSDSFSNTEENSELSELNELLKEIESAENDLKSIINEIDDLRFKIHNQVEV